MEGENSVTEGPLTRVARRGGWILMSASVLSIALVSTRYFLPGMPDAFQPEVYSNHSVILRLHIAGATLAILAGPMQFWSGFRDRRRKWHRRIGKTYLAGVAIGAPAGLYMAWLSLGGLVTHVGFTMLGLVWGGATLMAYRHIRAGNWSIHREWMIRSYSVAFGGFVFLRLWFPVLEALGAPHLEAYQTAAWLSWVPSLLIAELYIGWWRGRSGLAA